MMIYCSDVKSTPSIKRSLSRSCRNHFMARVESGSDDLDNLGYLGHFFRVSSGSHPQTKFIWMWPGYHMFFRKHAVLASGKWVNFGSDECTEISLVWNQLIIAAVLKHAVSKDFIFKKSVQGINSVSCQEWRNLWYCSISKVFHVWVNFNMWVTSGSYVGHIWIGLWVSGSNGSTGVTYFQPCSWLL